MSKPTGAGRNSKSPSILLAGSPLHTASSASLIYSPKPIKPAHAAISRSSQQWPFTAHGNHPEHTPMLTRRHSSALKPNSKRSSRYQVTRSEKKELNFIPSLSSSFPKDTGGTRARRTNSDRNRIKGGFFKLRLTVKTKEAHLPSNPNSIPKLDGLTPPMDRPSLIYFRGNAASSFRNAALRLRLSTHLNFSILSGRNALRQPGQTLREVSKAGELLQHRSRRELRPRQL